MADSSVDSVVTDPPYGLSDHKPADVVACLTAWLAGEEYRPKKKGFMGRSWDAWVPGPEVWREVFRVLKPGGHVVAFAGSRTHDLMSIALRLAGFECRDTIMDLYATSPVARQFIDSLTEDQRMTLAAALPADLGVLWIYGSGFPKSMNVGKAMAKLPMEDLPEGVECQADRDRWIADWSDWGTALKPAFEPALLFRKPLIGTVAQNVLQHGTGALNIDGCRVTLTGEVNPSITRRQGTINHLSDRPSAASEAEGRMVSRQSPEAYRAERAGEALGRWPANLIHDGSDEVVAHFPDSAGSGGSVPNVKVTGYGGGIGTGESKYLGGERTKVDAGSGSAARFFYCAKASRKDRNDGCDELPQRIGGMVSNTSGQHITRRDEGYEAKPQGNHHPTVKPTDLMRYLCRLVTPPGGVVLDPFTGSGSTGKAATLEGFRFVGCELTEEYAAIAEARIRHATEQGHENRGAVASQVQHDLFEVAHA
ncbi:site-specific DNA-methyltransferase (adenine-specific) [Oryzomicrobium terrae]|uniref:Methyltransferase n=1 Tax=Oryzomicrobium terrae TaxID=1735038 RepID=A0A5C1E830_9RHOO|nr:DNA methyltransferase [Oryzomicrobium terrae]QEL64759.1 site-specific DNA-methyltransferase (adenine-specific) [Oryzomicrobium terrae]